MSISYHTTISIILPLFLLITTVARGGATATTTPSAYEVLQSYDFPIGILPIGAIGYDLDPKTGKFNAYFKNSCSFSIKDSYQLKYKSKISGYIENDRLRNLSGVSVKILFFWVDIVEVVRKGDSLQFSVGIASAWFGIDNFYECPQCGCGFECNNLGGLRRIRGSGGIFVSSS
ncbi:hypothetical protein Leryth_004087 [Lithospermum erythrorhizon]|nr:hypothetical protein Leryth_004087 [Lithospermum erythrorhizon]